MSAPRLQRIAAYVVCTDPGDRLLLCRLTSVTARPGAWTLPGGGIEFGEHPEVAALRELREETGLTGRLGDLLCVDSASGLVRDEDGTEFEMHRVRIVYRAEVDDGPLTHEVGGSTDRAEWFTREQVEHLDLVDVASLGARFAWRRQRTDRTEAERGVHP